MRDFHTLDHNFKCCAGETPFSCLDQLIPMTMAYEENTILHAQIFVGRKLLVLDVFGMTSSSEFVNALEDKMRTVGACVGP